MLGFFLLLGFQNEHQQWVIELAEFDILYWPKTTIKAQALVDFIAEFTTMEDEDNRLATWMI